jgi:hypothetical protein
MFGEYQLYRCWSIGNVPENKFPASLDISKGNNILVGFLVWETKTHGRKKYSLNYHDEEATGVTRHLQMGLRYTP